MIPKELFHFTKKDIALEKILFERKIRLGQLRFTNDPKETKRLNISLSYSNKKSPRKWTSKVFVQAERVFKEEWNVRCMTKNLPKRKYQDTNKNNIMMQSRYGYAHPKMWAHYGENHSGICLVFDGKKLNANIMATLKDRCKIFSGSVIYKDYGLFYDPLDDSYTDKYGLTEGVRKYFFVNYQKLFLTKHPDWESEAEFRWLIHNPANSPEYVNIEGAIKTVLVGSDFPQVYEHIVKELAKELKISAGRIVWNNGTPLAAFGSIYEPMK